MHIALFRRFAICYKSKGIKKVGSYRICSLMVSFIAKYQDTILLINDYLFLLCYLSGKDHL